LALWAYTVLGVKKLAAGCLLIVFIGLLSLSAALYFGYRALHPMIDSATTALEQAKETAAQSDRLENKARYDPPASGELSEAQVRRYLAVHDRMRTALGPRLSELTAQAERMRQQEESNGLARSFTEFAALIRAAGSIIVDARRAHVDALNAEQFSESEYTWVRLRCYEAAGLEKFEGFDWSKGETPVTNRASQARIAEPSAAKQEVPERNRELVKPYVDALLEWLPLTTLGF
jgi:hypothetical protein